MIKQKLFIDEFYCTCCGKRGIPIVRNEGRGRELGHLKKLYCLNCRADKNFVEVSPNSFKYSYQDFLFEYQNGNFTELGTRRMPYGQFKNEYRS